MFSTIRKLGQKVTGLFSQKAGKDNASIADLRNGRWPDNSSANAGSNDSPTDYDASDKTWQAPLQINPQIQHPYDTRLDALAYWLKGTLTEISRADEKDMPFGKRYPVIEAAEDLSRIISRANLEFGLYLAAMAKGDAPKASEQLQKTGLILNFAEALQARIEDILNDAPGSSQQGPIGSAKTDSTGSATMSVTKEPGRKGTPSGETVRQSKNPDAKDSGRNGLPFHVNLLKPKVNLTEEGLAKIANGSSQQPSAGEENQSGNNEGSQGSQSIASKPLDYLPQDYLPETGRGSTELTQEDLAKILSGIDPDDPMITSLLDGLNSCGDPEILHPGDSIRFDGNGKTEVKRASNANPQEGNNMLFTEDLLLGTDIPEETSGEDNSQAGQAGSECHNNPDSQHEQGPQTAVRSGEKSQDMPFKFKEAGTLDFPNLEHPDKPGTPVKIYSLEPADATDTTDATDTADAAKAAEAGQNNPPSSEQAQQKPKTGSKPRPKGKSRGKGKKQTAQLPDNK